MALGRRTSAACPHDFVAVNRHACKSGLTQTPRTSGSALVIELIRFAVVDGLEVGYSASRIAADKVALTGVVHESVNYPTVSAGSGRGQGIKPWIDRGSMIMLMLAARADLWTRAAFKSGKATTPIRNTLLRIMYIMLNCVSEAFMNCCRLS